MNNKIYIAGPGVFKENPVEYGERLKGICEKYGYIGLYPLDNVCSNANEIAMGNYGLIDECDIVIADANPFRGFEMDSGTATEIGYAYAKNKRIIVYLDDTRSQVERMGSLIDENGDSVEDFDLPVNLMIGCVAEIIKGNFEDAVKSL